MKTLDEYSDADLFYMLLEEKKTAEKAFAQLYARHSSRVYAFCRRFLGNKEEAQDVFQETFIKFHQSASKDRDMTNVPAFLLTIARNLCVNAKKRERQDLVFEEYMYEHEDRKNDSKEMLELLKTAIDLLPDDYKEVFVLREYDGLSYADIAKITGENLPNIKVRIHRAKQKLKDILEPYLEEMKKFD